jgi:hypothetical protein
MIITKHHIKSLHMLLDEGLVKGMGEPEPGKMCVEAAVCYALGLPHGDDPQCVAPSLRALKIGLNDAYWSSNKARAEGLRRLAIVQLGSKDVLDEQVFIQRLAELAATYAAATYAADAAASADYAAKSADAAASADYAAKSADYADYADYAAKSADYAAKSADYAAKSADAFDKTLSRFAEDVVRILINMKAPGAQWLA